MVGGSQRCRSAFSLSDPHTGRSFPAASADDETATAPSLAHFVSKVHLVPKTPSLAIAGDQLWDEASHFPLGGIPLPYVEGRGADDHTFSFKSVI